MARKSGQQRYREYRKRQQDKGLVDVKVWIPNTPDARGAVNRLAEQLREKGE